MLGTLSTILPALLLGAASAERQERRLDAGWLFRRGLCPNGTAIAVDASAAAADGGPAPPPPPAADACAAPGFDDGGWRALDVPHDWSREDLPSRSEDREYPVLEARYGNWRLRAGDNASWAAPSLDDSGWAAAKGGADWRSYGAAFAAVNQTGWYRQTLAPVPGWMLRTARPLTLSLGIIAGADRTYLNGKTLGSTPPKAGGRHPALGVRLYMTPRAYAVPPGLLKASGDNVLAVRVVSYGGAGLGAANATNYTDAASFPPFGTTFPGGFFDDPTFRHHDQRVGMFDAAVSPGTMGTGYTLGGTGYYRKHFNL